jgi:hypothetical protein
MTSVLHRLLPDVKNDARGHFALSYYTAVAYLIDFVRRQAGGADADVNAMYTRYGFLRRYHEIILTLVPNDEPPAGPWWRDAVHDWARSSKDALPAAAIRDAANLSEDALVAFMLCGLVEEDARFGTLFADLQAPSQQRRPSLELISEILSAAVQNDDSVDIWNTCSPLLKAGLVQVQNDHVSRPEWVLRVPTVIWDAVRGDAEPDLSCIGRRHRAAEFEAPETLIYPPPFIDQLASAAEERDDAGRMAISFRTGPGDDVVEIAGALAKRRGLDLLVADAKSLDAEHQRLLGPICTLIGAMPLIRYDTSPGELAEAITLKSYPRLFCQSLGRSGGLNESDDACSVAIDVPRLDRDMRLRRWRRDLGEDAPSDLLADRFQFGARQIKDVARIAKSLAGLDGQRSVEVGDVRRANRQLCRQRLETLADHLDARGSWGDLISNADTMDQLMELQRRCLHREPLSGEVDYVNDRLSVCAMLAGPSGTGKTLASKILAAELGMDLYRLNLSGVVNKFLGETEKNLHRVFAQAEAADVILLLDEGDALLGSRTDVQSSNDRWANLETNTLLQALDEDGFKGIVLITTNRPDTIDTAFQRRMDVVINFSRPQTAEERLALLDKHLPRGHSVDPVFLNRVASRCMLHGGQIRNVALLATMLALESCTELRTHHLDQALRREYKKTGALFPLANRTRGSRQGLDADSLASALEVL